jgi:hypothetical protein
LSFFLDRCPACGVLIEQRTEGQNRGFHKICGELAKQLDWPRGSGYRISILAWKRLLQAAFERAHGRKADVYPALDGQGFDVVYRRSSRMSRQEMAELIPFSEAWAVDNGVKFADEDEPF